MDVLDGVPYGSIADRTEPLPYRGPVGWLYVLEFSSGWVKVGRSTRRDRISRLSREFRKGYGWEITGRWRSGPLSTAAHPGNAYFDFKDRRRADLDAAEYCVNRFGGARGFRLSDWDPRGVKGDTETFLGVSFGDFVAYADVVARCEKQVGRGPDGRRVSDRPDLADDVSVSAQG